MTKEILVSIKGEQFGNQMEEPSPIEIMTAGEYYFRNGNHYIKYEEAFEDVTDTVQNLMKIKPQSIEVSKKGAVNVHMVFEEGKKDVTYYTTPFGTIQMGIATTKINVQETDSNMDIQIDYALDMNEEHVSDCVLSMNIKSIGA